MSQKMKFTYANDKESKSFELLVKLSTDGRLYYSMKSLPEDVLIFHGIEGADNRRYFDEYSQLKDSVTEYLDGYEASFIEESIKRVIVYFVDRNDPHHGDQVGLSLGFRILERVTIGDESYYQERKDTLWGVQTEKVHSVFHNCDAKEREMDWTQEREDWFEGIVKSMRTLSEEVERGISRRPTLLAKQIDNGIIALLESRK